MAGDTSEPTLRQRTFAFLSLALVSTSIGITMKASQVSGKYRYSPASAVVMVELFKLFASTCIILKLILQETKRRLETSEENVMTKMDTFKHEAKKFWVENFSIALTYHGFGLALAYSVVNLVTFSIFLHAPASTFFLLKAASPVITALMLKALVNRGISFPQWVAVIAQCVGLVVTQYNPCNNTTALAMIGYILIAVNIAVSCAAGVWNEQVIKSYHTSVNAQNSILYSFGVVVNLILYFTVPSRYFGGVENLSFFEGYNFSVLCVIAANGSIGLVITAVYKYADVVVKTFGLAGSTAILYLLEALMILPASGGNKGGNSALMTVLGSAVVFYAAYLYIAPAPQASSSSSSPSSSKRQTAMGQHNNNSDEEMKPLGDKGASTGGEGGGGTTSVNIHPSTNSAAASNGGGSGSQDEGSGSSPRASGFSSSAVFPGENYFFVALRKDSRVLICIALCFVAMVGMMIGRSC